ncbi:hypothetical protein TanjilG_23260 [Lupinus angustifolius]|uniref:WIT1/2 N-terminal helical bundle domain-containing protein n=1 Tax=Lupinus angustifolius TaxID=3871 RepID=A0A1J7HG93_LUPAN|nr:PREDICTED: WPP domain-interacting tail-anchored protein 1-like isoform X2 [Lupinus angustifolius]OIW05434.1 hypothetical protein TanjilG_23260 [Lupinus angustifolius]
MDTESGENVNFDVNLEDFSSDVYAIEDVSIGVACFSEKVSNLSIFVMHLETLEGKLEDLDFDNDENDIDSVEKVLEFDLLCGVLESEIRELDLFLETLFAEISDAGERVLLFSYSMWNEKLHENEQCLKQCEEQFYEIKKQCSSYERTLSSYKKEENVNVEEGEIVIEDNQSLIVSTAIKMQTIQEQRDILRMLEKSLASEMDLEKNFNDSKEIEEKLTQRVFSLERELDVVDEEANNVWERWLEADNASDILMSISKDLLGRLQISQFNLNGLSQRESELSAKLETVCSLEKQLKESECKLLDVTASADEYQILYNGKCSEIRVMENLIVELKENASKAESRANTAEAESKLLKETNTELNNEMILLKDSGGTSDTMESLERLLKESDLKLQHAVASAEACQEKQSRLYSTIKDMEHVIKDLKSKVSKSESRADSAEEKCIMLSEYNAELNEEVNLLKNRLECLEESLHQMEEAKVATAKDINKQTVVLKQLLTQLAVERERLYKQLSSLASENKILVGKLKQTCKDPFQEVCLTSATSQVDKTWRNLSANDNVVESVDSMPDVGTVRRIDAGVLSLKYLIISVFVLMISAVTFLYLNDVNADFSL